MAEDGGALPVLAREQECAWSRCWADLDAGLMTLMGWGTETTALERKQDHVCCSLHTLGFVCFVWLVSGWIKKKKKSLLALRDEETLDVKRRL